MSLENFLIGRQMRTKVTRNDGLVIAAIQVPRNPERVFLGFYGGSAACDAYVTIEDERNSLVIVFDITATDNRIEFWTPLHGTIPMRRASFTINNAGESYVVVEGFVREEILRANLLDLARINGVY